MDAEKQPLFEEATDEASNVRDEDSSHVKNPSWAQKLCDYRWFILAHFILILLYTAISAVVIKWQLRTQLPPKGKSWRSIRIVCADRHQAIAHLNVNQAQRTQNILASSEYSGPPDTRVDEAWANLLDFIDIRVTAQELQHNNRSSVALPKGGYLAWLGVFHEASLRENREQGAIDWLYL
jgi:hypothetical protein